MSIILALLNGFLWSLLDLLRKKSLKYFNEFDVVFALVSSQLLFFSFLLFFVNLHIKSMHYVFYILPLIVLNTISLFLFLRAIKLSDISLSIPLLSFTPLFSTIYAYFFLREKLYASELLGIVSIIIGILILYAKSMSLKSLIQSPIRIFNNSSARYMIIIALIWSLTPVLDKKSLEYTNIFFHGFLQSLGTISILILFFLGKKNQRLSYYKRSSLVLILGLVGTGFLAVIIQLFALGYNNVALLEATKRATGIILAVFYGYIFFKERVNQQKIIGVLVAVFGIYCMYKNF